VIQQGQVSLASCLSGGGRPPGCATVTFLGLGAIDRWTLFQARYSSVISSMTLRALLRSATSMARSLVSGEKLPWLFSASYRRKVFDQLDEEWQPSGDVSPYPVSATRLRSLPARPAYLSPVATKRSYRPPDVRRNLDGIHIREGQAGRRRP
jgi:hypothetical protein